MIGIGCPFATTNRRSRFLFKYTSNMQSPSARISISLSRGKGVTKMQQPARHSDDGIARGEAVECFTPNAAAMRAEALSRKDVHAGAVAFSRTGDPATG